ncbi:TDT family transporter [Actinoplanes sp. NPDC020271]|uniref:TDT family transporter n=1 Tax=Actinoplanes sp. NPDC020271 TaxID=3363896 RepID=UPI0037A80E46
MRTSAPNRFASVMGTGILAVAATTLPWQPPGLHPLAMGAWVLATVLLLVLLAGALRNPRAALSHRADPALAHFYGAPPMALLTVGAGTLLVGRDLIGTTAAVAVDWVLWSAGTAAGLVSAVAVPYLQFTRHGGEDGATGAWLIPVVPPMVSATTGALLVPHAPAGQIRLALVLGCWAMFGLSLVASFVVLTMIWQRLAVHRVGAATTVPALWIGLGPLGQSITAANALGDAGAGVLPSPYAHAFRVLGALYGVPTWGFALLWAGLAAAVTVRAARAHLPFTPGWWSFTFPVGTCVTGTSALAAHLGSAMFALLATVLYGVLLIAWAIVAVRTVLESRTVDPRPREPLGYGRIAARIL